MQKLAVILIVLMSMLAIIPPLFFIVDFTGSEFFPKVFNLILFMLLTGFGILIPYTFESINNQLKSISLFMAGWFLSMLIYEVSNFCTPESILIDPSVLYVWMKYFTCFILGVGIVMVKNIVSKWN